MGLSMKTQVAAKIEDSEGVPATLTGSELLAAVLAGPAIEEDQTEIDRDLARDSLTHPEAIPGTRASRFQFQMELVGPSGSFPTNVSPINTPLRACGMRIKPLRRLTIAASWTSGTVVNDGETFTAAPSGATGKVWSDTLVGDAYIFYETTTGNVASGDTLTFSGGAVVPVSGTFVLHVPYRGGAACQADLMGKQVDLSFQNLGAVTGYIKGGRMKALAVTAKARHPQLPDVPTVAEAGFPDLVVTSWQAAAAPAKTPREVVARLNDAAVRALRSPDIRERMTQIGFDVVAGTPEEFGQFMKAEVVRWTTVVNRGGIKPD